MLSICRTKPETYTTLVFLDLAFSSTTLATNQSPSRFLLFALISTTYNKKINAYLCRDFGGNNSKICTIAKGSFPLKFTKPNGNPNDFNALRMCIQCNVVVVTVCGKRAVF